MKVGLPLFASALSLDHTDFQELSDHTSIADLGQAVLYRRWIENHPDLGENLWTGI